MFDPIAIGFGFIFYFGIMKLLDDVVSGGFAFRLVLKWWEIALFVLLIVAVIYLIRRRRK
jgi:hypothetical protein